MREKYVKQVAVGRQVMSKGGYGVMTITEKLGSRLKVVFNDGTTVNCKDCNFYAGNVKNPNHPKVVGIGFMGQGPYNSSNCRYAYKKWLAMMHRCYSPGDRDQSYSSCEVHPEWHNFQNFAKWIKNQVGYGDANFHLDKDILNADNKLYSPETCRLVPSQINYFLIFRAGDRGPLPLGVGRNKRTGKYSAQISIEGTIVFISQAFMTLEDAMLAYKAAKEAEARRLAEKYKSLIDRDIYNALANYVLDYNRESVYSGSVVSNATKRKALVAAILRDELKKENK